MEVHVESPAIDPKQVDDVKALLKEAKRPVILLQSQVNSRIERVHSVIIIKGLLNQDTHIMYHQHNITCFWEVHVNKLFPNHMLKRFFILLPLP